MAGLLRRATAVTAMLVLSCAAAVAATRSASPSSPSSSTDTEAPSSLPWWKRSLAHTVQEEWVFAQHMDMQYGPRWRTALPDKVVANLFAAWSQERGAPPK
ncbi:MAG: hypothetical protein FJ292_00950 [Planctomycetes bacterium]|nr:hypothetical protein [Planctomycetota bacterium]